jgi:hypothetical protein
VPSSLRRWSSRLVAGPAERRSQPWKLFSLPRGGNSVGTCPKLQQRRAWAHVPISTEGRCPKHGRPIRSGGRNAAQPSACSRREKHALYVVASV